MPEIAVFAKTERNLSILQFSFAEAGAVFEILGDNLDDILHGVKVAGSETGKCWHILEHDESHHRNAALRIINFIYEEMMNARGRCDEDSEWAVFGIEG